MPKAYTDTVIVQNDFFRNNSDKSELIETKFYRDTWGPTAHSSANFWRPLPNRRKMAPEKPHLANLVTETMHRFTHFTSERMSDDFREF